MNRNGRSLVKRWANAAWFCLSLGLLMGCAGAGVSPDAQSYDPRYDDPRFDPRYTRPGYRDHSPWGSPQPYSGPPPSRFNDPYR